MKSIETKIAWAIARIANCLSAILNPGRSPAITRRLHLQEMSEISEEMGEIIEEENTNEEMK